MRLLIECVARGEEVILTYRGRDKAKIVPLEEAEPGAADELFGLWEDRTDLGDVEGHIDTLREGRG
jgi:antitoxin (DNA-binding transcriptional repressor) of toxin-antitoxin stability system